MTSLTEFPFTVPLMKIDKNYKVLEENAQAIHVYGKPTSLMDVIDVESHTKMKKWIHPKTEQTKVELHTIDLTNNLMLADCYISWKSDLYGDIMLIEKDTSMEKVSGELVELRSRLADTNFDLLKEKERAEELLYENTKLTAPFIKVAEEIGLIPIFGYIDWNKANTIKQEILHAVYLSETSYIIIDFTAITTINREGLACFERLLQSLHVLGKTVYVSGIQPAQAEHLKNLGLKLHAIFVHSLQAGLTSISKQI